MKNEIEEIKDALNKLGISPDRIKRIDLYWEKIFPDKAFPKIKIKLYK